MIDMGQKIEIVREAVIGFVVTKSIESGHIFTYPLTGSGVDPPEGDHDNLIDDDFEKVIGVLPAPPNSFKVFGHSDPASYWVALGFEYEGADNPDWAKTYPKRKQEDDDLITAGTGVSKSQRTEFKKLREILHETTDVYGEVLEETVLAAAETQGLGDAPRVLDMLKRLKQQGEIYALKEGVWVLS